MEEQICALRALSTDDQDFGCLAIPCHCDVEHQAEELLEEMSRRASHEIRARRSARSWRPVR